MSDRQVIVKELAAADIARWDAFVERCPTATFFHKAGWKRVLETSFGHRTFFLYAERGGQIVGVLPLAQVKSRLFGNALTAMAFCVQGGPATDDAVAKAALDRRALELADQLDVDHLEYRSETPTQEGWQVKQDLYVTFRRALETDPEKNLTAIPRKQRAEVRKGLDMGLDCALEDGADNVWAIYAESVRNLGTPVFGRRYFRALKAEFGEACECLVLRKDGEIASGVLSFYFRDQVLPYYGGGSHAARGLRANELMYYDIMRRASAKGCRVFDFGRSKLGTGAFNFKKNWGFKPIALNYEYKLRRGDKLPELNPLNPKYRLMIETWKRLPLAVANTVGPWVARSLG
jgi:FemAB-related protein (PEP-CTERM system-associated)